MEVISSVPDGTSLTAAAYQCVGDKLVHYRVRRRVSLTLGLNEKLGEANERNDHSGNGIDPATCVRRKREFWGEMGRRQDRTALRDFRLYATPW